MSRDVIDSARKSAESAEAHPAVEATRQRMAHNFALMDGSNEYEDSIWTRLYYAFGRGYLAVLTGNSREELRALGLR